MATNETLTRAALVVGTVLLLVLVVDATIGTAALVSGNQSGSAGIAGLVAPSTVGSGNQPSLRALSTDGVGSVTLSPDEVQVTVGVLSQAPTAQAASESNAAAIGAIVLKLNSLGVSNSSMSTTVFSVGPLYNYTKTGTQSVYAYQAVHTLMITQQSPDVEALGAKASQVIDGAVTAGANQVGQVYFTLSDQSTKSSDNQALQLAIQDAASRADLMASSLGVSLSGVVSVSSSTQSSPAIVYRSTPQSPVGQGASSTAVIPGNFTVTASVQVVYGIK